MRRLSLTPDLVALCERDEADPGPSPHFTPILALEIDALARQLADDLGDAPLWLFAYGSLIWKPDFDHLEHRRGTLHGWHRSFCLELRRWRGSPEQPGLMLALESGGSCVGVAYRLPDADKRGQLRRLVDREITTREDLGMVRWVEVRTATGPLRSLVFWAGPTGRGIASRQPLEQVARVLARACGHAGSCASYLYNTVTGLEGHGIRDRNLWRLQALTAAEIRRIHAHRLAVAGAGTVPTGALAGGG